MRNKKKIVILTIIVKRKLRRQSVTETKFFIRSQCFVIALLQSDIITCENWTGRRTLRGIGSADVLLLFAAFYGLAFSWQCSSVFDSRSKTFLTLHLRTEKKDRPFIIIQAKSFKFYEKRHHQYIYTLISY